MNEILGGLSNSHDERAPAQVEPPTPISDDVRSRWVETHFRDNTLRLVDKDGTVLQELAFNEPNFNHYMGGPLENAARLETDQLARINAGRRSIGEPEVESLAALEQEQKQRRGPRRNLHDKDNVAYPLRTRERIQGNIRTTFRDLHVTDEVLQKLEQAVGKVENHATARALADYVATLPRKPGVPPAGGRQMAQRPKIASHEGDPRQLTPGEIAAHAESLTGPAGGERGGADYEKKMTPYTPEELAEAKKNLQKTFNSLQLTVFDDTLSKQLNKRITDSTTPGSVRALAAEMRAIEDARAKALGRKIEQNRENAPGVYSNRTGSEFIEQNGNLYIREGKAIRLATEREKTERAARLQAEAAANGLRVEPPQPGPEPLPPRPPRPGDAPPAEPPPPRPPRAADVPEPLPPPPRERFDRTRFQLNTNADNWRGGPAGGVPHYYLYLNPDGTPRRNPDGSERRYTQEEHDRLLNPTAPPEPERPLDITKFKRVRDTGPGGRWAGGFGTPRRFFYVHPDAPRNPDGSQRRFTEEEYQELIRQAGESSPDEPTVGRLHRGEAPRDPFEINKRDYVNIRVKSLREIAGNENDQKYFGEFMANLIPGESAGLFARAMQDGSLTEQERKIIFYAQHEYSKRLSLFEKMSPTITGKSVEQAMKRYPALEAAVRLNDSTGNNFAITTQVWKEELLHIAMRKDAADFNEVYAAQMKLSELHETRRFKNWDGDVTTLCKRAGVNSRDYDALFNLGSWKDRRETRKWLKLNLQKDLKGFAKVTGALGLTTFKLHRMMKEADRLGRKETDEHWISSPTSWTLRKINTEEGTLARVMALTIGEPEKLRALTKAAMRNEEMQLERDAGPRTAQGMNAEYASAARGELSQAELQRLFNAARKPAGWNTWDTARREDWRDNSWNPGEVHQGERRVGMWAQIFSAFKNWLFNDQKKKLSVA